MMVYLPLNHKCCCPQFSMRIDTNRFQPNKAQRRVRERFARLQTGKWVPSIDLKSLDNVPQFLIDRAREEEKKLTAERLNWSLGASESGETQADTLPTKPTTRDDEPSATSADAPVARAKPASGMRSQTPPAPAAAPPQAPKSTPQSSSDARSAVDIAWDRARSVLDRVLASAVATLSPQGDAKSGQAAAGISKSARDPPTFTISRPRARKCGGGSASGQDTDRGQCVTNAAFVIVARIRQRNPGSKPPPILQIAEKLAANLTRTLRQNVAQSDTPAGQFNLLKGAEFRVVKPGYVVVSVPELARIGLPASASRAKKTSQARQAPLRLRVQVDPATYTEPIFNLYAKYQTTVHKDPITKISPQEFKSFLVKSPLMSAPCGSRAWPHGYGSLHRKYMLSRPSADGTPGDEHIVGVGVLDVTPRCFYSSYFIWHPKVKALSLGVLSALEEFEIVRGVGQETRVPYSHYHYIGYYVHKNKQMRYKLNYGPAELYCPFANRWVSLDARTMAVLDRDANGPIAPDAKGPFRAGVGSGGDALGDAKASMATETPVDATAEDSAPIPPPDVRLYWDHKVVEYKEVCEEVDEKRPKARAELAQYVKMVGQELASRMMYIFT